MTLNTILLSDLSTKEIQAVDHFILNNKPNGEFINTLQFLSYHSAERFADDSIVIMDMGEAVL